MSIHQVRRKLAAAVLLTGFAMDARGQGNASASPPSETSLLGEPELSRLEKAERGLPPLGEIGRPLVSYLGWLKEYAKLAAISPAQRDKIDRGEAPPPPHLYPLGAGAEALRNSTSTLETARLDFTAAAARLHSAPLAVEGSTLTDGAKLLSGLDRIAARMAEVAPAISAGDNGLFKTAAVRVINAVGDLSLVLRPVALRLGSIGGKSIFSDGELLRIHSPEGFSVEEPSDCRLSAQGKLRTVNSLLDEDAGAGARPCAEASESCYCVPEWLSEIKPAMHANILGRAGTKAVTEASLWQAALFRLEILLGIITMHGENAALPRRDREALAGWYAGLGPDGEEERALAADGLGRVLENARAQLLTAVALLHEAPNGVMGASLGGRGDKLITALDRIMEAAATLVAAARERRDADFKREALRVADLTHALADDILSSARTSSSRRAVTERKGAQ